MGGMSIRGIQRAQERNLHLMAALRARTIQEAVARDVAITAHREAVVRTHVDTGALRAAHRIIRVRPRRGRHSVTFVITPDPRAVRPDHARPAVYGLYEHRRGGKHAFYRRAVQEGRYNIAHTAAISACQAIRGTR